MTADSYTKAVLTAIAVLLAAIACRLPERQPASVLAQSDQHGYWIEPGTTIIRRPEGGQQAQGKVVIDPKTGDVWGFPTDSSAPYPVDLASNTPPVSPPVYLGRFDFSRMISERTRALKR